MKLKPAILVALICSFALDLVSCSQISNGIPPAPTTNTFLKGADGPPLWLVDNVEVAHPNKKGSLKISPTDIQRMTVLSPTSNNDLVSRYGQKAKNGVVLITTKNAGK